MADHVESPEVERLLNMLERSQVERGKLMDALERARAHNSQLTWRVHDLEQRRDATYPKWVPMIERKDDMGLGRLRLIRQEDGDVCLAVISKTGRVEQVEFCAPMTGGGKSERTWWALQKLMAAMEADAKGEVSNG